jgi:hypothetical protein
MPLFFADGSPFVTGSQCNVSYEPTPAEPKARLVLRVAIAGLTTQAMVDTGGHFPASTTKGASAINTPVSSRRSAATPALSTTYRHAIP